MRSILEAEGLRYEIDSDGDFRILLAFDDDRTQLVWVNSNTTTFAGAEIRKIWSVGLRGNGQLTSAMANELLERNSGYKVGSWSTVKRDGNVLAIFTIAMDAGANRTELTEVIRAAAIIADEVEKEFHGDDVL